MEGYESETGPLCGRSTVVVTPPGGAQSMTRAGHTLSILRKQGGQWLSVRDAALLAPVPHNR
jgi:ketosteroid isomerase-like protein